MSTINDKLQVGVAYQEIVLNADGSPCDFIFLQTNQNLDEMLGLNHGSIVGKRLTELVPQTNNNQLHQLIQQLAEVALFGGVNQFTFNSAHTRHRYKIYVYSLEKNRFWTNVVDMFSEQELFLELQKRLLIKNRDDQAFSRALDRFPLAITIIALDGTILYVNDKSKSLFDVDNRFICTKQAKHFFANEKDIFSFLPRISLQKASQGDEVLLKKNDGTVFWSKCDSMLLTYHNQPCILSTHQNISGEKNLALSAANSEENDHLLFDNVAEAIVVVQNGYVKMCNHYVPEMTKYSQSYLVSRPFADFIAPQDRETIMINHNKQMLGERSGSFSRFRIYTADGRLRWIAMKSVRIDWRGKPASLNFLNDITDQRQMEEALKLSEEKYKVIFENSTEAIFVIQNNRVQIANSMTVRTSGYSLEELMNTDFSRFILPADRIRCIQAYQKRLETIKANQKMKCRIVKKDGAIIWAQARGTRINWDGKPAVQYFVNDVTDQIKAEQEQKKSEQKYRLIAEYASDVIWVYNYTKTALNYISPSVKNLLGYSQQKALMINPQQTFDPESWRRLKNTVAEKLRLMHIQKDASNTFIMEVQQQCRDKHLIWVELSIRLRLNDRHEFEIIGVSRNIEERKIAEANVAYLSHHDQLTGLYNRRFYDEALKRLDRSKSYPLTLVLADVNGLKLTNDAFGHRAGDDLLIHISKILIKDKEDEDIIARVGGDEFVMLWPQINEGQAEQRIERIHHHLQAASSVHHTVLSVSFGWAVRKSEKETMTYIFTEAENNMYQHKLFEGNSMRSRTINMITNTLYAKLPSEGRHARRVSRLCTEIGRKLGMDANDLNELKMAGLLHDIGKITIEESLFKKEQLTDSEWARIKLHPEKGYHILKLSNEFMNISQFILCHHERIDGKGYPLGLKSEEIPLPSRIISIVEAYDSMVTDQPYRQKIAQYKAIEILKKNAGTQFDPEIVDLFVTKVLAAE
ncbi:PAS domain S-box protein [Sporolactobacillus shoreicorticis]|uniref:PAS domain S-box protein n=1 Tax=Sporolactobacillus shoreicorticis TaxID=1923877 RepID=A0ABW5S0W5_9BACL|nr:PAS domain S-box protein [Sporolactobacillus shoreicorticis]MCO7127613.1 PAS domain S-box protein [Sporolactobacillus shoreicorticis]